MHEEDKKEKVELDINRADKALILALMKSGIRKQKEDLLNTHLPTKSIILTLRKAIELTQVVRCALIPNTDNLNESYKVDMEVLDEVRKARGHGDTNSDY